MIPLFPYKHISFSTSLTLENAIKLVSDSISPARYSVFQAPIQNRKGFHGQVSNQGFTISIPQDIQNALAAFMFGKFTPSPNGVKIDIRLTLHPLILIPILLVWLILILGFVFNWLTIGVFIDIEGDGYTPLWILIISYLLVNFFYFIEAVSLERFILDLFEGYRMKEQ